MKIGRVAVLAALVAVAVFGWRSLKAPPIETIRAKALGFANGKLNEEFGRLISVRELSDGRVLLADGKTNRLAVGDFTTGAVATVGRSGDGPGEYRQVGRLWPLNGDSTFMSMPNASRWILLHDTIAASINPSSIAAMQEAAMIVIRGADSRGGLLSMRLPAGPDSKRRMRDSMLIVRSYRSTGLLDTIGRVRSAASDHDDIAFESAGSKGAIAPGPRRESYIVSLKARDQLAVFADGVVAIVRGNPYRVEWCEPATPCKPGPVLLRTVRPMSTEDKAAYLTVMNKLSEWPPTSVVDDVTGWPETLPPFVTPGGPDEANAWAAPGGQVVVERIPTAATPYHTYDVIDHAGKLFAVVKVSANQRVIGFGKTSVYMVEVGDDQIQRVQRYAWNY